jgi:flavin reductase (DIM6/NTAB) family NADH-FMN oxidoreductase RutF
VSVVGASFRDSLHNQCEIFWRLSLEEDTRMAEHVATEAFKRLMGSVCSHVCVVTTMVDAHPYGTTVTAFCSLSLRPPMIVVALDRGSRLLQAVNVTRQLGVNLLSDDQSDLAAGFATKSDNKFEAVRWHVSQDNLPSLEGNAGWLSCRVRDQVNGGDHDLLLCDVVETKPASTARRPLVYCGGVFGTHSELDVATL